MEKQYHEKEWSVEEDALAFLTDAGLVGRLTMSQQGRWPTNGDTVSELEHKLGECIWWVIILAKRMISAWKMKQIIKGMRKMAG